MIVLWFYVVIQLTIIHGEYVERIINGKLKRCIPVYNCPPGNEILPCIEEFTKEQCQPCYNGSESRFVQPDYISSVDGTIDQLKCFKPLRQNNGRPASCTGHDQVYSKTLNTSVACINGQGCRCNLTACSYGDPCLCDDFSYKHPEKCPVNFHLDNSGKCVPCPPGYKKDTIGCGPCLRVPGNNTIVKPSPVPETTTAKSSVQTYHPKPPVAETTTTTTTSTTATVVVSTPGSRGDGDDNSATSTIVGAVVGFLLLIAIIVVVIVLLNKNKKLEKFKAMCHGNRRDIEDRVVAINQHDQEEELQLLNRNENFNNLGPEQQDNINNMRNMHVIERNISHVSVTDKPDNNNLTRVESECPSVRFNSDSSVSINRQLSNMTVTDRINSTASENSPLMQVNSNSPCVNRANSVPERQVFHHGELLVNRQVLNRAESVPQQVSCEEEDGDICINIGNSPVHSPTSQLLPSPTRYQYMENGGGACIPLPDFDNIQSSSPVMNTELPNIAEFKRSLSKDSESSVDNLNSTSPYSSIPEETGKEIQEEVTAVSNPSTTMLDPPHMSDVRDYNDCHNLSHVTDIPQASDITNQIDSRLEQYNHTVTGVDEDSVCSIQRLPSEHEEETAKKNDLDSNLDSGMASKLGDSDLSSKSDCS